MAISKLSAIRRAFSRKIDAAGGGQTLAVVCCNSASQRSKCRGFIDSAMRASIGWRGHRRQQRILAAPVVERVDEFANHRVVDAGASGDLVDERGATVRFSRPWAFFSPVPAPVLTCRKRMHQTSGPCSRYNHSYCAPNAKSRWMRSRRGSWSTTICKLFPGSRWCLDSLQMMAWRWLGSISATSITRSAFEGSVTRSPAAA